MLIIPAIDLRGGKVVRLTEGAFDKETIYSASPADVMQKWQTEGAELIHVVDLDGALEGTRKNLGSLKNILAVAKVPIQFGGGLRSLEAVQDVLNVGVWRAVIGTKALDTELVQRLVDRFKERIAVGMDVRDDVIQTHGWVESENSITPEAFSGRLEKAGVRTIICTDINRDGTLKGPNVDLLKKLMSATRMNVISSGGISSIADIKHLAQVEAPNFEGVIVGKALYEQRFSLREAVSLAKRN